MKCRQNEMKTNWKWAAWNPNCDIHLRVIISQPILSMPELFSWTRIFGIQPRSPLSGFIKMIWRCVIFIVQTVLLRISKEGIGLTADDCTTNGRSSSSKHARTFDARKSVNCSTTPLNGHLRMTFSLFPRLFYFFWDGERCNEVIHYGFYAAAISSEI
jgi:hypothetical protein